MDKLLNLIKQREAKDWIVLGSVMAVILFIVFYIGGTKANKQHALIKEHKEVSFSSGTEHGDLKSYFTSHVKRQLGEQSQKVDDATKIFSEEIRQKDKELEGLVHANKKLEQKMEELIKKVNRNIDNKDNQLLSENDLNNYQAGFNPNIIPSVHTRVGNNSRDFNNAGIDGFDEIELVSTNLQKNKAVFKDISTYLPAGTHIRGIIVGGVDAHTEVYGDTNTRVVTIRFIGNGTIPNGFKGNMKNCTLLASAWGNASSERVAMRGERLTCVSDSGKVLETKILATVYGNDGRQDVRGRMVYPEGKLLQRAFLAGSLSGIGNGIAQSFTSQSISPLGATSVIPNQDVFKYGAAQGVGKGLDKLADYYIKRAEQLQPIIQVGSGTKVDVIIQKGFYLDGHDYKEESSGAPASPFEKTNHRYDAKNEAQMVMSNIKETM